MSCIVVRRRAGPPSAEHHVAAVRRCLRGGDRPRAEAVQGHHPVRRQEGQAVDAPQVHVARRGFWARMGPLAAAVAVDMPGKMPCEVEDREEGTGPLYRSCQEAMPRADGMKSPGPAGHRDGQEKRWYSAFGGAGETTILARECGCTRLGATRGRMPRTCTDRGGAPEGPPWSLLQHSPSRTNGSSNVRDD